MPRSAGAGVAAFVDRAVVRCRLLVAAEAAAAGAVLAAWSAWAGFIASIAFAVWRGRQASRRSVLQIIERADSRSRNLIVTADELASGGLGAKAWIRERVEADADALLAAIDPGALFPIRRIAALVLVAVVAWGVAALSRSQMGQSSGSRLPAASGRAAAGRAPALKVTVRVEPPAYTHLAPTVGVDPVQIDAVERANIGLSMTASGDAVTVDTNGEIHRLVRAPIGSFELAFSAVRSGFVLVTTNDGARRMIPLSVQSDALPVVKVTVPGRDLLFDGGNPKVNFTARASDDFGLRSLTLRFTKVSGSGEQFAFTDGEIPLEIARSGERDWSGSAVRTIAELGLSDGDMLVYRAVAADMRPGGGETSSDAFYVEVSRRGVAAGDAFTLPEQETRYALSQQMLIVKTDRLNHQRASLNEAEFSDASQSLAVEQRMIRSEFVFMLGGEIEDEEVEAEQSVEIQAGRLVNRGQRDIREATVAMSQAEKLLTAADTAGALRAERAAVEALQRAFARGRYILRALASRSQLDLTRRLTGSVAEVVGWRRQLADVPPNRAAIAFQSLLQGLGEASTRQQLEVLSEFAVRIDPESSTLRGVAGDLQKLADTWDATESHRRQLRLDAIAEKVAIEARRVVADPPFASGGMR